MLKIPTNGLVKRFDFDDNLVGTSGDTLGPSIGNSYVNDRMGNPQKALGISNGLSGIWSVFPTFSKSVSVWFKSNANHTHSIFNFTYSTGDLIFISYNGNNQIVMGGAKNTFWSENTLSFTHNTNWNHAVLTYDGSNQELKMYINGVNVKTVNYDLTFSSNTSAQARVGLSPGGYTYANFQIDELLIYDRVLSDTEVTSIYNANGLTKSIKKSSFTNDLMIYPNPSTGIFHIQSEKIIQNIQVFDLLGNKVFETTDPNILDLSHLPNATYMVRVQGNNEFATKTIIKQ